MVLRQARSGIARHQSLPLLLRSLSRRTGWTAILSSSRPVVQPVDRGSHFCADAASPRRGPHTRYSQAEGPRDRRSRTSEGRRAIHSPQRPPPEDDDGSIAGRRATKQKRSAHRQQEIADAAIAVIGEQGLARVTHKMVADRAGVSLAATTYYFETKADIVAEASGQLLQHYVGSFGRFADRHRAVPTVDFLGFFTRLLANVAGGHRTGTLAWCEIMLDAARRDTTRRLARSWFDRVHDLWLDITALLGVEDAETVARSGLDLCIGLFFVILPLGLDEAEATALPFDGLRERSPTDSAAGPQRAPARQGRKAVETRGRIVDAAMAILAAEGPGGVTYRAVADRANLTRAAPTYHFPTIEGLIGDVQIDLFDRTKARYREGLAGLDRATLDAPQLIRSTAAILRREATEFGLLSLADLAIRLEAARHPTLRPIVRSHIEDQNRAWLRILRQLAPRHATPAGAMILQSLCIGKLVRIAATGGRRADVDRVREELAHDIGALLGGAHWTAQG
ncbi:MAG: TetR family transcriptional regulator [Pseudomonadota bacterium]